MQDEVIATPTTPKRVPWNKGKLTGAKPPLRLKHVWSIRTKLQIEGHNRDLALFNLAIRGRLRSQTLRRPVPSVIGVRRAPDRGFGRSWPLHAGDVSRRP